MLPPSAPATECPATECPVTNCPGALSAQWPLSVKCHINLTSANIYLVPTDGIS